MYDFFNTLMILTAIVSIPCALKVVRQGMILARALGKDLEISVTF